MDIKDIFMVDDLDWEGFLGGIATKMVRDEIL